MLRALKPILFVPAVIYFGIDELFSAVARPIAAWLARQRFFHQFRNWSLSLRPYAALALFVVPLLILEPVKPIAAYLAATGHLATGGALFVLGEILKLVLLERLFQLNRRKLMSIPAFAWCYVHLCVVWSWLESFAIWQSVRRTILALQRQHRSFSRI
jgi:Mn2+/Fe2+ NRAMP family transporter